MMDYSSFLTLLDSLRSGSGARDLLCKCITHVCHPVVLYYGQVQHAYLGATVLIHIWIRKAAGPACHYHWVDGNGCDLDRRRRDKVRYAGILAGAHRCRDIRPAMESHTAAAPARSARDG